MKKTLTALSLAALFIPAHAATLAHYQFDGSTYADSAGNADVTAADLARGAAMTTDSNFSTFTTPVDGGSHCLFIRGAGLNVTPNSTSIGFTEATTDGNYFEITVSTTELLNLTSLQFDTAKNDGNVHSFRVLVTSDLTGHNFDDRLDITVPAGADSSLADVIQSDQADNLSNIVAGTGTDWGVADNTTIDLSGSEFQGVSSITLRVYGFAINAPTSNLSDILRFDNVIVNGEVVPVPEPNSVLLGALGLLALRRRRRS